MKKILLPFLGCAALSTSAFAGHAMQDSKEYKQQTVAEPCFKDQELQADLFASWNHADNNNPHKDGWGGGIAINYFFMRYLGVGIDGNVYDGVPSGKSAVWDTTGRLIVRYPIEGSVCIAPYAFAGGGVLFDSTTVGTWHVGGGVEVRVTHSLGVFAEGRYTWGAADVDAAQVRGGIRFVF